MRPQREMREKEKEEEAVVVPSPGRPGGVWAAAATNIPEVNFLNVNSAIFAHNIKFISH